MPFFIRTGKRLAGDADRGAARVQEPAAASASGCAGPDSQPNQIVIKLDPSTGVRFELDAQRAPSARTATPINLDMEFADEGGEGATPYEVLLHAAMVGQTVRFTRQDGVEEAWRIMQPLLDAPPPVHTYEPGSWGPEAASTRWSPATAAGTNPGSQS